MEKEALDIINKMPIISLEDVNKVGLMDRVDTKFYFHERQLSAILKAIWENYSILEIRGERIMPYESCYYDTASFQMLNWHQNGKLNRYKIRKRKYLLTQERFLEVKFKNNKGKTKKYRMLENGDESEALHFIKQYSSFEPHKLKNILNNKFSRMMLVNKQYSERVSIDVNLGFSNGNDKYRFLDDLVVLEIKSESNNRASALQRILKNKAIYPSSFSKFVTGMYMFHKDLKYNRFKNRFRQLDKILENNTHDFT